MRLYSLYILCCPSTYGITIQTITFEYQDYLGTNRTQDPSPHKLEKSSTDIISKQIPIKQGNISNQTKRLRFYNYKKNRKQNLPIF